MSFFLFIKLLRGVGPPTSSLPMKCSATELQQPAFYARTIILYLALFVKSTFYFLCDKTSCRRLLPQRTLFLEVCKDMCTFLQCLCNYFIFIHFVTDIYDIFNQILRAFCSSINSFCAFVHCCCNGTDRQCNFIDIFFNISVFAVNSCIAFSM